jgi:hypothetical protein
LGEPPEAAQPYQIVPESVIYVAFCHHSGICQRF